MLPRLCIPLSSLSPSLTVSLAQQNRNRAGNTYSAAALNRVLVGNIPRVLSSQDVRDLFAVFGDVASVDLQTDQASKLNEGHATVSFVKSEDATRAQLNAGWLNICGQKLTVVLAADQAARA